MSTTTDLALPDRLKQFGRDLSRWRAEAARLAEVVDRAVSTRSVDEVLLLRMEESATLLYGEIAAFDRLLGDVAESSPTAAGELAAAGEELRLLLLEVTELSTRLYSIRSTATASLGAN